MYPIKFVVMCLPLHLTTAPTAELPAISRSSEHHADQLLAAAGTAGIARNPRRPRPRTIRVRPGESPAQVFAPVRFPVRLAGAAGFLLSFVPFVLFVSSVFPVFIATAWAMMR